MYSEIPEIKDGDFIFLRADSGYDLYVKKLGGIDSILLTESQKDPLMKKTNYGLRTEKFYPANGDEIRILDGKELHTSYEAFYLVDSTIEYYPGLGDSFHFFLPEKVFFGYPWARTGTINIIPGIKINLRLFDKKYADYSGTFKDQWITLRINYTASSYRPELIEKSREFTDKTKGITVIQSEDNNLESILDDFTERIKPGKDADVIFIIDTTESMVEEIPVFKKKYPEIKKKSSEKIDNLKIGVILFKDYGDIYLTKISALSADFRLADELINGIMPYGGQDIPEARNEAICELEKFDLRSDNRYALLITDAPPHPVPRGSITEDDAINIINKNRIDIEIVCLQYK